MSAPKERLVPPAQLAGLLNYLPLAVGATNSYAEAPYPAELSAIGINPREDGRNTYVGMTVSRPVEDLGVYGLTWDDDVDGHDNEDFITLDLARAVATTWPPKLFEAAHPEYANLHHAAKPHLRPPPKPTT